MNSVHASWFQFAHADLDAAQRLFKSPKPTRWTYLLVLWHCDQTIEKGIKAVMVKNGQEILKVHDLPRLSHLAGLTLNKKQKRSIESLNVFYLQSRYPDILYPPLPDPNRAFTQRLLKETEQFLVWLEQQ